MAHYLLSVIEPVGPTPPAEFLEPIMARIGEVNAEIRAAGAWVYAGGLHGGETATMVLARDGDVVTTDGPFAEGKEHLGGISIVDAPDLDAALGWARKLVEASGLSIEVRPFRYSET
ncbi:YciI family protein [Georgenia faecalis]|uniref:YciI family protein n=1 Tax=Georgenia faecalis TaxID=2483799 RepID=UPI000FDB6F59|nr:YciI family protein [Georgenia faecalis]